MHEEEFTFETPDDLVTLATFENPTEVFFARSMLQSAGIECFLPDEHIHGTTGGFYTWAIGGMRLQVRASQADDARALLEAIPTDTPPSPEDSDDDD